MLDSQHAIALKNVEKAAAQMPGDQYVEIEKCLPDFGHEFFSEGNGGYFAGLAISFAIPKAAPTVDLIRPALALPVENSVSRRALGSDWIFVKLYVGESRVSYFFETAVKNLVEALRPHLQQLHFLRFADPDFHIRLQFLQPSIDDRRRLISDLIEALEQMVLQGVLSRVVYDVYDRDRMIRRCSKHRNRRANFLDR